MKEEDKPEARSDPSRPAATPDGRPVDEARYPLATIACYGPDDQTVTKITVGVFASHGAEPLLKRWRGEDIISDPVTRAEIADFLPANGVQHVVMTGGVIGCPHEEGIDYPEGEDCPYCPFWRGK